jgi:hypothetical protein
MKPKIDMYPLAAARTPPCSSCAKIPRMLQFQDHHLVLDSAICSVAPAITVASVVNSLRAMSESHQHLIFTSTGRSYTKID